MSCSGLLSSGGTAGHLLIRLSVVQFVGEHVVCPWAGYWAHWYWIAVPSLTMLIYVSVCVCAFEFLMNRFTLCREATCCNGMVNADLCCKPLVYSKHWKSAKITLCLPFVQYLCITTTQLWRPQRDCVYTRDKNLKSKSGNAPSSTFCQRPHWTWIVNVEYSSISVSVRGLFHIWDSLLHYRHFPSVCLLFSLMLALPLQFH